MYLNLPQVSETKEPIIIVFEILSDLLLSIVTSPRILPNYFQKLLPQSAHD